MKLFNQKPFIIGLGTGRCGTTSLAKILSNQPGYQVSHENNLPWQGMDYNKDILPWEADYDKCDKMLKSIKKNNCQGDIAFYWLPYVEYLIKKIKNIRFIVLERNKEEVVKSYMKWTQDRNHWMQHDGIEYEIDKKWDLAYPKYNTQTKEDALSKYWEEYHNTIINYNKIFPNKFIIIDTYKLNEKASLINLFSFLKIKNPIIKTEWLNKNSTY